MGAIASGGTPWRSGPAGRTAANGVTVSTWYYDVTAPRSRAAGDGIYLGDNDIFEVGPVLLPGQLFVLVDCWRSWPLGVHVARTSGYALHFLDRHAQEMCGDRSIASC